MDTPIVHASEDYASFPQGHTVLIPTSTRTLKFNNSDEANAWLHSVTMLPPIDPNTDPTIDIIASQRQTWVLAMIDATYDLTSCADNPKMLAHFQPPFPSFISELEVEAACHNLFDILISYCRYGYRGLPKTNVHAARLSSGKKNFAEDKAADCVTRMGNIITALRSWKSVCKGVVEEDTKKWQLVNAPVGVVGKKESERRCNVMKKKAADEGKKAKVELVKVKQVKQVKQVTASRPTGASNGHQDQVSYLVEAPHLANAASSASAPTQHHGAVGADDAGKWIMECPQDTNATNMQAHKPLAPRPQGTVGTDDAGKWIQEYPQLADTNNMQTPALPTSHPPSYSHTPETFTSGYQQPYSQVHGLQSVSHQHNWPSSTFYWPQGGLDGDATQYMEPQNVDNHDEHFWQGLDKYEDGRYVQGDEYQYGVFDPGQQHVEQPIALDMLAQAAVRANEVAPWHAVQYQDPASAVLSTEPVPVADDKEQPHLAGGSDTLAAKVWSSLTSDDLVHEEVNHSMQYSQAVMPSQGVKRGRKTSDTDEDAPAARRQKLDEE